jgi:transposase
MLPDRESATVEAWLKAHPGAAVICRDRATGYGEAARAGAPGAVQVAGHWRLWHNLAEYADKTVARHRGCLLAAAHAAGSAGSEGEGEPPPGESCPEPGNQVTPDVLPVAGGQEPRIATRTRERYDDIRARIAGGQPQAEISRATGLDRKTVRRFARAGSIDELLARSVNRESKLDEVKPYLCRRWNDGVRDAAVLHAELRRQGWNGSVQTVRRYLAPLRKTGAAAQPPPAVPKTRQITRLLLTRPDRLQASEAAQLEDIRAQCPHLDSLTVHVRAFAEMMANLTGSTGLDAWLTAVEADDQPELHSFATGIRNDKEAVVNGLSLPYSSGRVEGTVNKIKTVKRQMYGRASFSLLRRRVILHPASRVSQLSGLGVAGQRGASDFPGFVAAWADAVYSGAAERVAECGVHVGGGGGGLGPVPRVPLPALRQVGGGIAGDDVPADHQGLDQERERDGPLNGFRNAAAGVAGTGDLLAGRVGGLDGPPPGVPLDRGSWGQGRVEGEDAQVIGFLRAGIAHQDKLARGAPEAAVPQSGDGGGLDVLPFAVDPDGHVLPVRGLRGIGAGADPVSLLPRAAPPPGGRRLRPADHGAGR